MNKKGEISSDKSEKQSLPYSTVGTILLVTLAIVEYVALFLTMPPIRFMMFQ